jgi:DNA polymerase family B
MLVETFKYILKSKYSGYSIYLHNFSKFDAIFLIKTIVNLPGIDVNLLHRDGNMLEIKISYGLRDKPNKSGSLYKYSIKIYDSYLIQPVSLDKLGKSYGIETKGMFPLKILNDPNISYDYKGKVPPIHYFYHPSPIKVVEYQKFVEKYNTYKTQFVNKE